MSQEMYEIIEKLKGVSCLISAYATDGAECRWSAQGMEILNDAVCDCIERLEKLDDKK